MGLFKRFEDRLTNKIVSGLKMVDIYDSSIINMSQDTVINIWDDETSSSSITEDDAMGIPALNAGINLICSSIASLPINLYKIDIKTGEKEIIRDDYRNNLLNVSNNMFENSYNLKYAVVKNLILHGTSYVYIVRNRNTVESLYYLDKSDVNAQLIKVGKNYDYKFSFTFFQDYINCDSSEMIVFSKNQKRSTDLEGQGILKLNAKLLNLALEEMTAASNALTNKFPAYLSSDNALSPVAKDNIRYSFKGLAQSNEIPIFEEGLKYNQISVNSKDLELLESRQYTTQLISNILNLPLSFLTSSTSYNTSEEESLRFQRTILPYIRLMEETLNKHLLTVKELDQGFRFEFDTDALMKISRNEYMNYLSKGIQAGIFTINEARKDMNLTAREGGDLSELPVNMYFLNENGEIILPSQQIIEEDVEEEPKKDAIEEEIEQDDDIE